MRTVIQIYPKKMAIPYKASAKSKKEQVSTMFNAIAHRYDFLNHFLSLGIDKCWRRKAVNEMKPYHPSVILDVASGTGDFAIAAMRLKPQKVQCIDISEGMLEIGKQKMKGKGLDSVVQLEVGDCENLRFETSTFDAITVGFGVRNFENLEKGLAEMLRVLKPGGVAVILEFSKPKGFVLAKLFTFYFKRILPSIGAFFSKDKSAYTYLPESVQEFPSGSNMDVILRNGGFVNTKYRALTLGIATIYVAEKTNKHLRI